MSYESERETFLQCYFEDDIKNLYTIDECNIIKECYDEAMRLDEESDRFGVFQNLMINRGIKIE